MTTKAEERHIVALLRFAETLAKERGEPVYYMRDNDVRSHSVMANDVIEIIRYKDS